MASKDEDILIAEKEFHKMKLIHQKSGYRDGLVEGKETTLQEGFNKGFKEGINSSFEVGQLTGEISAYMSWFETQDNKKELVESLQELKDKIQKDSAEANKQQMITVMREKLNHIILSVDYKRDSK